MACRICTLQLLSFETAEERWGYWAKHIYHNRYQPEDFPLQRSFNLVKDKDYFVITTNVDGQFMKTGFAPERFFEVQGNYGSGSAPFLVVQRFRYSKWKN